MKNCSFWHFHVGFILQPQRLPPGCFSSPFLKYSLPLVLGDHWLPSTAEADKSATAHLTLCPVEDIIIMLLSFICEDAIRTFLLLMNVVSCQEQVVVVRQLVVTQFMDSLDPAAALYWKMQRQTGCSRASWLACQLRRKDLFNVQSMEKT